MLLTPATARAANGAAPFPIDVWEPSNQQRHHVHKQNVPLAHASKPWHLYASVQRPEDDYWLADSALIQDALFDVIFCRNVMMYLESRHPSPVLERMASQLAPDGALIIDRVEQPTRRSYEGADQDRL